MPAYFSQPPAKQQRYFHPTAQPSTTSLPTSSTVFSHLADHLYLQPSSISPTQQRSLLPPSSASPIQQRSSLFTRQRSRDHISPDLPHSLLPPSRSHLSAAVVYLSHPAAQPSTTQQRLSHPAAQRSFHPTAQPRPHLSRLAAQSSPT